MVIPFKNNPIDRSVRTHVIVVSKGNDLGLGPQLSGLTKAVKLAEVYPDDQVVLFVPEESAENLAWIQRSGFSRAYRVNSLLDTKKLFEELEQFNQIASFHTYGHSAIPEGVFLDAVGKRDIRWYPQLKFSDKVIGHFTSDAFATLNGCNLGHSMAPLLSRKWNIPVSGALVGTHFEVLMPDGQFVGWGPEKDWAKTSVGFLRNERACLRGCVRMRPDRAPYDGHYGKYRQGLANYKFFCSGITEADCLKGMARSLISSVTSFAVPVKATREQFARSAREWLCPSQGGVAMKKACDEQLLNMPVKIAVDPFARLYTPFRGPSNQCDFTGCYASPQCLELPKTLGCATGAVPPKTSSTFVDEYENFLRGFDLLGSN